MMNTTNVNEVITVKVGTVPGAINEYAMEQGTTVQQALELAGLNADGFDARLDGVTVENLNYKLPNGSQVLLLVKKIKGNMVTVKVGTVPGAINDYALNDGSTVREALELASLDSDGYDIRMDGTTVSEDDVIGSDANVILLVKKIKGNMQTVKIGTVPGAINEYAVEDGTLVSEALELAQLNHDGYDIRVDGNTVSSDSVLPEDAQVVLLVKKIKGNK